MTPDLKEQVVRLMRQHGGRVVLMCGDGSNDVGALKQADVGVALLTGFGAANAKEANATSATSNLFNAKEIQRERSERVKTELVKELAIRQKAGETGGCIRKPLRLLVQPGPHCSSFNRFTGWALYWNSFQAVRARLNPSNLTSSASLLADGGTFPTVPRG
jgi:hypothetical protein